jgi:hypothetical protein
MTSLLRYAARQASGLPVVEVIGVQEPDRTNA